MIKPDVLDWTAAGECAEMAAVPCLVWAAAPLFRLPPARCDGALQGGRERMRPECCGGAAMPGT